MEALLADQHATCEVVITGKPTDLGDRDGMRVLCKLKVVSATFLLVCFLHLKESTCETRTNVFYFTSKALFVLEIIKFNFSDIQMS